MSSSAVVERRIWWFTVSNTADKSRRMSTDERDKLLATRRYSVTMSRAVSVECVALNLTDEGLAGVLREIGGLLGRDSYPSQG